MKRRYGASFQSRQIAKNRKERLENPVIEVINRKAIYLKFVGNSREEEIRVFEWR